MSCPEVCLTPQGLSQTAAARHGTCGSVLSCFCVKMCVCVRLCEWTSVSPSPQDACGSQLQTLHDAPAASACDRGPTSSLSFEFPLFFFFFTFIVLVPLEFLTLSCAFCDPARPLLAAPYPSLATSCHGNSAQRWVSPLCLLGNLHSSTS